MALGRYALTLFTVAGMAAAGLAADAMTKPAGDPARLQARIDRLMEYYSVTYGQVLRHKDPFARCLGVMLMARIDDPRTTEPLMKTLTTDGDALVRLFAWEALQTRDASLTAEQYSQFVEAGASLIQRGVVRGDLRVDLIRELTPLGPDGLKGKVGQIFLGFVNDSSPLRPIDSRTLAELRKTAAAWRDKGFIRQLIERLNDPSKAASAEYVLGDLTSSIQRIGSIDESNQPTAEEWKAMQAEWGKWLARADLKAFSPGAIPYFGGPSSFIPRAEKLDNPDDPKWRQDLELQKLLVQNMDLVFCIDATGSMKPPMEWLGADLARMMGLFSLVVSEPRVGIVHFRHEVDPALMAECCKELKQNTPGPLFRTRVVPLTGNVMAVAQEVSTFQPKSGSWYHPSGGAVHGGLFTALKNQPWSNRPDARKIVVLIGDSPITQTAKAAPKAAADLAAKMHKDGWVIHALTLNKQPTYEAVAAAGGGVSVIAHIPVTDKPASKPPQKAPAKAPPNAVGKKPTKKPQPKPQIAEPGSSESAYSAIAGEILRSLLPEGYRARVEPVTRFYLLYAEAAAGK